MDDDDTPPILTALNEAVAAEHAEDALWTRLREVAGVDAGTSKADVVEAFAEERALRSTFDKSAINNYRDAVAKFLNSNASTAMGAHAMLKKAESALDAVIK